MEFAGFTCEVLDDDRIRFTRNPRTERISDYRISAACSLWIWTQEKLLYLLSFHDLTIVEIPFHNMIRVFVGPRGLQQTIQIVAMFPIVGKPKQYRPIRCSFTLVDGSELTAQTAAQYINLAAFQDPCMQPHLLCITSSSATQTLHDHHQSQIGQGQGR
jgi:hypothetical protein